MEVAAVEVDDSARLVAGGMVRVEIEDDEVTEDLWPVVVVLVAGVMPIGEVVMFVFELSSMSMK